MDQTIIKMTGKTIEVIKNMYSKAKSVVSVQGVTSSSFYCNMGVRQGENLSPLLFSIYLVEQCTGLRYVKEAQLELLDREINYFLKLYLLMYADDTVLLAESPDDLQTSLNKMQEYCTLYDLNPNRSKTKVMILLSILRMPHLFYFGEETIEVVNEYNYLGIVFTYNANFFVSKQNLYQKGNRAMLAVIKKIINFPYQLV